MKTNGNTINQLKRNLRVPFREIALSPSKDFDGNLEENPPVRVYDTSGVWTDETVKCNVCEGLPQVQPEWIIGQEAMSKNTKGVSFCDNALSKARFEFR